MNLHHLRVFLAVAEAGGISAGAARLHISQPAVTREIRELEASVGLALFDRQPRGVRLTEGGQRLLQHAQRLFALERAAERELRAFAGLDDGELRLGASATLGAYVLPPWVERFHARHPAVLIELQVSNTRAVTEQLDDGRISLGFVEGPFRQADYAHHRLARDTLLPVVGPGHPLAGRSNLLAADLATHSLYLREPGSGTRACIEQAYATLGLEVQARMSVGSSEALKRLVAGGQGIAWLSEHAVDAELAQGRLLRLDLRDLVIERDLHVLWRAADSLSPAPAAFLQDLLDAPGNIKTF
ncbi:LysR family transcriptional regulator [Pseudomonas mangiferae]|uniref:LysR family transcriptional regulator n=1 Tax=Pseudomonas mangiferae TaxID=2593654 RepID=A0A553GU05_9PSED|nr:LysR family transcriptional regulator [Pseudomonas mangiferae]TRX72970.1 LysR family transcriptional regulator [Pseudomonas mangiferae]